MKESTTNANQGAIVLIDQAADHGRLRSVLYDWGYTETEIHRFLNENEMGEPIQDSMVLDDRVDRHRAGLECH